LISTTPALAETNNLLSIYYWTGDYLCKTEFLGTIIFYL